MANIFQLSDLCNMQNQWVVLWTPLGLKDLVYRLRVQSVGPQSVNCFGGDGHQPALFQDCCGLLHRFWRIRL